MEINKRRCPTGNAFLITLSISLISTYYLHNLANVHVMKVVGAVEFFNYILWHVGLFYPLFEQLFANQRHFRFLEGY